MRYKVRLPQPSGAGAGMYELMESCWEIQPKARPTFTAMLETLTAMLKESEVHK
jgi:hypothetical protein